jgi:hypothetical protein
MVVRRSLNMSDSRLEHLVRFYAILDQLERTLGGPRRLADCRGRMDWPQRGVYFFRESGESRTDSGELSNTTGIRRQ